MTARSFARRGLSWSNALAAMRADRMVPRPIREEQLRAQRGAGIDLGVWRGLSGRRYVVQICTIEQASARDGRGVVIIGVRRRADGIGEIVGCGHRGTIAEAIALCRPDGANEIHLHRLADTEAARDAIVEDLVGDDAA